MADLVTRPPVVSVIMNCYNSAEFLAEAIDSVYAQIFTDWEIIFWDNCSTDNSVDIVRRYDGRLRYFRGEKNVPLGHARNLAIEKAQSKYIAFLDCDDIWVPEKLQRQVAVLDNDPALGLVFSDALFFGKAGRSFRALPLRRSSQGMIFAELLRRYVLPMPTVMMRRDVLDKIGGWFDERFYMVEDADLFMRVAYYYSIAFIAEPLARRRMHEKSWTAQKKELFPVEQELLLKKFADLWPSFEKEHPAEIRHMRAIIQYQYAVIDWEKGDNIKARRRMAPCLGVLKKMWVPFLFSYFPISFYKACKRGYKFVAASFIGALDDQSF